MYVYFGSEQLLVRLSHVETTRTVTGALVVLRNNSLSFGPAFRITDATDFVTEKLNYIVHVPNYACSK